MTEPLTIRQAEALRYQEMGLSLRETGRRMGIAHSTAYRHICRARERLGVPATRTILLAPETLDHLPPERIRAAL